MGASIVISTKNRPDLWSRCVRAVLDHEVDTNFEVIIVNDAGCPVSTAIWDRERVTVVERLGRGPAAARNLGIERTLGEIVLFTDNDAVPQDGWIRAALSALAGAAEAVGVARPVESPEFDPLYEHSVSTDGAVGNFVTCNIAYWRRALIEVGGFDEGFPYPDAEDRYLGYRMRAIGPVLFGSELVVVHGPRPARAIEIIRRARHLEADWLLHRKHPQTRPPRWSVRWGPTTRFVRAWQRLLTDERNSMPTKAATATSTSIIIRGSPRRAGRFAGLAIGRSLFALYLNIRRWPASSRPATEAQTQAICR